MPAPAALARQLETTTLVDVREPVEWNAGHLRDAIHIPLQQLPRRLDEIPRDRDVVVYCRSGGRSARAVDLMRQHGFTRVKNLAGGLHKWATDVDPTVKVV